MKSAHIFPMEQEKRKYSWHQEMELWLIPICAYFAMTGLFMFVIMLGQLSITVKNMLKMAILGRKGLFWLMVAGYGVPLQGSHINNLRKLGIWHLLSETRNNAGMHASTYLTFSTIAQTRIPCLGNASSLDGFMYSYLLR